MAEAKVVVLDSAIIGALNTPGRPVSNWRDGVAQDIVRIARSTSPVNNVENAMHRGGFVGDYRASWDWDRGHSGNQHIVRAIVINYADHAQAVEYGTPGSSEFQVFSFTGWFGTTKWVGPATPRNFRRAAGTPRGGSRQKGYEGKHILRNAVNAVVPGATLGTFSGLT